MPPENRTGPLGEGAGSETKTWATSVNTQGTAHHDTPRVTGDIIDQAIAGACTIRGCACDADITIVHDGPIRRVTVAHDEWCPALGGDAA